jgi:ribonuclease HI
MEIKAVLDAVSTLAGPLDVVSDSTYVVNCFRDRWWERWRANGWRTSARRPVANRDLWEPLVDAYLADPHRVRFRWVKGHGADPMNDMVDRLAVEAADTQRGGEGDGPPAEFGPADRPAAGAGRKANATRAEHDPPAGHLLLVTGLKPPALGGYGDTSVTVQLRRRLAEVLEAKRQLHPDLTVLTGLGLGSEQLGAEAAASSRVPYVAVLAFPGAEEMWSPASRRHFADLLDGAVSRLVLDRRRPASRQAAGGALARRDAWLARHATEALVVWDGRDAGVGRAVRSLRDHLGEEEVWVLEPTG